MPNYAAKVVGPGDGRRITVLGLEVTIKLTSAETAGGFYVFENPMAPGDRVPTHNHTHEDELIEVLAGELEITLGGQTYRAKAGAVVFFPRNVPHGLCNPGTTTAKVRVTVSPGANFEAFFEELSSLPDDGPPDLARVAAIFEEYGLPIVQAPPV